MLKKFASFVLASLRSAVMRQSSTVNGAKKAVLA
jgi:hypothetical protein